MGRSGQIRGSVAPGRIVAVRATRRSPSVTSTQYPGQVNVDAVVARALKPADPARTVDLSTPSLQPRFRFVDVFAGIGGMRAGLEMADGRCVFTVEKDVPACRTYSANWNAVEPLRVQDVETEDFGAYDLFAAGFPCQPFSLAGVVKKEDLKRKSLRAANQTVDEELVKRSHGFHDPVSGNLFFEIVRLIGGPWNLEQKELEREATESDAYEVALAREGERLLGRTARLDVMPPVLLLENVRNLESHDKGRTFRVIRRRLIRSGYWVQHRVISGKHWVPQDRRRVFIVALRRDLFDRPFEFPESPSRVVGLSEEFLSTTEMCWKPTD